MTPTSFEFRLTMPGDPRLVGAVRQLTAQAAGYARLSAEVGQQLAEEVERATESAIQATQADDAPIEFEFTGDQREVSVRISCAAAGGSPHTRHIRQRIPA
jgi:hypothetical protein